MATIHGMIVQWTKAFQVSSPALVRIKKQILDVRAFALVIHTIGWFDGLKMGQTMENRAAMTGNGNHSTYHTADDLGFMTLFSPH